jgi:hypothetical protein
MIGAVAFLTGRAEPQRTELVQLPQNVVAEPKHVRVVPVRTDQLWPTGVKPVPSPRWLTEPARAAGAPAGGESAGPPP